MIALHAVLTADTTQSPHHKAYDIARAMGAAHGTPSHVGPCERSVPVERVMEILEALLEVRETNVDTRVHDLEGDVKDLQREASDTEGQISELEAEVSTLEDRNGDLLSAVEGAVEILTAMRKLCIPRGRAREPLENALACLTAVIST